MLNQDSISLFGESADFRSNLWNRQMLINRMLVNRMLGCRDL